MCTWAATGSCLYHTNVGMRMVGMRRHVLKKIAHFAASALQIAPAVTISKVISENPTTHSKSMLVFEHSQPKCPKDYISTNGGALSRYVNAFYATLAKMPWNDKMGTAVVALQEGSRVPDQQVATLYDRVKTFMTMEAAIEYIRQARKYRAVAPLAGLVVAMLMLSILLGRTRRSKSVVLLYGIVLGALCTSATHATWPTIAVALLGLYVTSKFCRAH